MGFLAKSKRSRDEFRLPQRSPETAPSVPAPSASPKAEDAAPRLSGADAAEMFYSFVTGQIATGRGLLIASPTVRAYEVEQRIVRAFDEGITEEGLASLLEEYRDAHGMPGESEGWTGEDVPLFYVSVKKHGRTLKGYTANRPAVRIITELWRRRSPETELDLVSL